MDKKELSLLNDYYGKLMDNTFDEKDVYGLLFLIRHQSQDIRPIKELADFVAHRDRYEGPIKEYLFETRKKFESLGKTKTPLRIEDVFSFKEIKQGINKVMADCQLNGLSNEKINDFVACLISLLQQVKITQQEKEVGKLFFAFSSKQIILMAEIEVSQNLLKKTNAVFPVLTANNNYINMKKQDRYDTPYLVTDKVVEVTNHDGKLEIIIPD